MPASRSAFARSTDMCPIEAQRLRLVCSAPRGGRLQYFSKSRLDSPWPWVTMQKRCAPAASAARACSSICSGSIIACIGVSASAKRDWAQKPQSSAQPPDLALTSEHMSVESPKRSTRAATRARSAPRSRVVDVVLDLAPRTQVAHSSRVISGGIGLDRHLHLHRLEYHDRVTLRDLIADRAVDAPHHATDMSLDRRHPCAPLPRQPDRTIAGHADTDGSVTVVVVTARDEAERLASTLEALAHALPAARIVLADDGSRDATPSLGRAANAAPATDSGSRLRSRAGRCAARRARRSPRRSRASVPCAARPCRSCFRLPRASAWSSR
jgi:hypothetical protein